MQTKVIGIRLNENDVKVLRKKAKKSGKSISAQAKAIYLKGV